MDDLADQSQAAAELLKALKDRGIDIPEMDVLARSCTISSDRDPEWYKKVALTATVYWHWDGREHVASLLPHNVGAISARATIRTKYGEGAEQGKPSPLFKLSSEETDKLNERINSLERAAQKVIGAWDASHPGENFIPNWSETQPDALSDSIAVLRVAWTAK